MRVLSRGVSCAVLVTAVLLLLGTAAVGATAPGVAGPAAVSDAVAASSNGSAVDWDGTENATTAPATGSGEIRVTYRVDRTPADPTTVRVNYTAVVPENVNRLKVFLGELGVPYTVESTDGLQYDPSTNVATADSEFGTETTVRMSYTVESNASSSFVSGLATVETREWAFLAREQLFLGHRWRELADDSAGFADSHVVDGEGYAADGFAFLGPATTYQRTAGGQAFTLVVPAAAETPLEPETVLDGLANASATLQVGDRDPTVTAFVAPEPIRRGGRANGAAFWVDESATLAAGSTWHHEYTHTRQAWTDGDFSLRTGSDAEWLTEAFADYYGGYVAWQTGTADATSFREYVATDRYATDVLQDANSDAKELKNYYKGRRVLAALDVRLRQHTGGTYTLTDLFGHLNSLPGSRLEYADLRGEVVAKTNESTGNWLDRYVTTSAVPTIPTDVASAYGAAPDPALTVALSPASVTANESAPVAVTVTDGNGAAVRGATVTAPALGATNTTDASGVATLRVDATAGNYSVSVSADGFPDATATLEVRADSGVPASLQRFTGADDRIGNFDVLTAVNAANSGGEVGGERVSNLDVLNLVNYVTQ